MNSVWLSVQCLLMEAVSDMTILLAVIIESSSPIGFARLYFFEHNSLVSEDASSTSISADVTGEIPILSSGGLGETTRSIPSHEIIPI